MALQTSGAISLNQIHIEAGGTNESTVSMNDSDIRSLNEASGKTINNSANTTIDFDDFYGASGGFGGPGGGNNSGCIPYGIPVLMADGTYKNVEDLVAGDIVQAYNIDGLGFSEDWYGWSTTSFNGTAYNSQVVANPKAVYTRYYLVNNTLKVTNEHAVLIRRNGTTSFEAARDIAVGDQMLNESYEWIDITTIEEIQEEVQVANPDVENVDNYFAAGFLVHNPGTDLQKDDDDDDDDDDPGDGPGGIQ